MQLMFKLFVAFCVATVLAQGIILTMAGVSGNLTQETIFKAVALLNGIDISGERLQSMLDSYRNEPIPTYEEIRQERAERNLDLQMREESVARMRQDVDEKYSSLQALEASFDKRLNEFYEMLDREKANLLAESLQEVKRTLEAMAPDQAKDQLLMLYSQGQKEDVVAILKGMPIDKRRKIVGEFVGPEEADQLNEILRLILEGEPTSTLLDQARESTLE
jgi:flagellar motility protein MotE (MotC chaperone)